MQAPVPEFSVVFINDCSFNLVVPLRCRIQSVVVIVSGLEKHGFLRAAGFGLSVDWCGW